MTSIEYRLKYEYLTYTKIEEGFDIHHIDFNRRNNNIKNLVSIPKKLHQDYHKYLNILNDVVYNNKHIKSKDLILIKTKFDIIQLEINNYILIRDKLLTKIT